MYQPRKKILPILLPSVVEAENFLDRPRSPGHIWHSWYSESYHIHNWSCSHEQK